MGKVLAGYAGLRTGVWILTFQVGRAVTSSLRVENPPGRLVRQTSLMGWLNNEGREHSRKTHNITLKPSCAHSSSTHMWTHIQVCIPTILTNTCKNVNSTWARMLNSKLEFNSLLKFTNLLKWGNNTWKKIASKEFNDWITDWWWPLNCWDFWSIQVLHVVSVLSGDDDSFYSISRLLTQIIQSGR